MKETIITWLRQQLQNKPAVLGLSGGVDSAVVAYLLSEAIGTKSLHGFFLPSATNHPTDATDVAKVATALGITVTTVQLDPLLAVYQQNLGQLEPLAFGNLKARIRMTLLYAQANRLGAMVVGTGNKTELQLGYFTKYGDGGVDLLPLAHLYKTQVWELAKALGVPTSIIAKAPSAGLWAGQTDEAELGMTYATADAILQAIEQQRSLEQFQPTDLANVQQRVTSAQHKLTLPPHL